MNQNYLSIPIQIRGLYLPEAKMVAAPLADFTKLPYNFKGEDYNFSQPFVGDGIVHHPFNSQELLLKDGFHIQFLLPHFLGQQVPKNADSNFTNQLPPAPNRWLVKNGSNTWLIESDFIHEENEVPNYPTALIPFKNNDGKGIPYRYMGRTSLLGDTRKSGDYFKTLNNGKALTAHGYGDPRFSSFYPNSMGVFAFYDANPNVGTTYQIVGWYADATDDVLNQSITNYLNQPGNNSSGIEEFIKSNFKIEVGQELTSSAFSTIYYGEIQFDNKVSSSDTKNIDFKIAVGNTSTEAISAMIANASSSTQSPGLLEDQLESILLLHKLDAEKIDVGAKFKEARHEKGFKASHSGHLWKIITQNQKAATGNAPNTVDNAELTVLPDSLAQVLHTLNVAQFNYDQAQHQLVTLQQQLYHDWFKYMLAAYPPLEGRGQYPDPDHLRYFIENFSFTEIDQLKKSTGTFTIDANNKATPDTTGANDLATIFCTQYNAVVSALNTINSPTNNPKVIYELSKIGGPRFWEATQPTLLISGLNLAPEDQNINLSAKPIYLAAFQLTSLFNTSSPYDSSAANDLFQHCLGKGSLLYSKQTWDPIILDWQVELLDAKFQNSQGSFDQNGIKENFNLHQFSPDFEKNNFQYGNASVFSGSTFMSTSSRHAFLVHLRKYVMDLLTKDKATFNTKPQTNTTYTLDDFLQCTDAHSATEMLNTNSLDASASSILFAARNSYQWLYTNKVITQTLGGFNKASVMLRQTAQLPIDEPLGFQDAKKFTQDVASEVNKHNNTSPIVAFDFNPIRCGRLSIERLSLLDNFGVATEIPCEKIQVISNSLKDESNNIFLKPRIVQPARLNFRWLASEDLSSDDNAFDDEVNFTETNDHPITTPVCGWLMANYFNDGTGNSSTLAGEANILAVYNKDGKALGFLDGEANWNLMPWAIGPCDVNVNIKNRHLLKVVKWVMENFKTNFSDFIKTTQIGLNNISPAHASTFDIKSVLMGRPMAVVRSRVSLQIKGKACIDQGWASMLADLSNCDKASGNYGYDNRNNNAWTNVKFPIRLGEHHQLNDGVVLYWKEDEQGKFSKIYSPEIASTDSSNNLIDGFDGRNQVFWKTINDAPDNFTMLLDPRGMVHATTGILPTKVISIPPQHYVKAMNNINMWFAISPLLQPVNQDNSVVLNLPEIPNYEWQWWDKYKGTQAISKDEANKNLHQKNKIIEGWLSLNPSSSK